MDEEKLQEQEAPEAQEVPSQEIAVEPPEAMKVSWGEGDLGPVPTIREVRTIRIYANESGRQLRVMKTADSADCLHIYVDVV